VTAATDEIIPGLIRLEAIDGTRLLCQFLLVSGQQLIIVDAGLPTSPWDTIVPTINELGFEPADVTLVLTHPDADHCGGTAGLRAAYPGLKVVAHAADSPPLGSPSDTIAQRYDTFARTDNMRLDSSALARIVGRLGAGFEVDERITCERWFSHRQTRGSIVHIPGHSHGHLGIWMPDKRALIAGDAVMGYGIRNLDGSLLYPPQFLSRSTYEATLDRIAGLNVDILLCAHEAPMYGADVAAFIRDSRDAIGVLEANVMAALNSGAETLADLCQAIHENYPGLPPNRAADLAPSTAAILQDLQANGTVQINTADGLRRFHLQRHKDVR
jgi:glyoxylase-like metal-dependent hydrolase (beta-lactamase superfamily II)